MDQPVVVPDYRHIILSLPNQKVMLVKLCMLKIVHLPTLNVLHSMLMIKSQCNNLFRSSKLFYIHQVLTKQKVLQKNQIEFRKYLSVIDERVKEVELVQDDSSSSVAPK